MLDGNFRYWLTYIQNIISQFMELGTPTCGFARDAGKIDGNVGLLVASIGLPHLRLREA
jgi:hypothetical protein